MCTHKVAINTAGEVQVRHDHNQNERCGRPAGRRRPAAVSLGALAAVVVTVLAQAVPAAAVTVPAEPAAAARKPFDEIILDTGTELRENGNAFDFAVADWDGDALPDLVAIKRSNTATRSTEVHILSGRSGFKEFILRTKTALSVADAGYDYTVTDWDGDARPDLVAVQSVGTDSRRTELYILSGSSEFKEFLLRTKTALPETTNFDFTMAERDRQAPRDLVAIKRSNTATRSTEVHILSAGSGYQEVILETGTPLPNGFSIEFAMPDWDHDGQPDLAAIQRNRTESRRTEVQILSGSSLFQKFSLEPTGTALPETAGNYEFAMADWDRDGQPDLFAIQRNDTVTRSNRVRILRG